VVIGLAIAVGIFAPWHVARASWTLVQHVSNTSCPRNNASCTVTVGATGSGNVLVATVFFDSLAGAPISSVSGAGTWNLCPTSSCFNGQVAVAVDAAYNLSSTNGITSITVTLGASGCTAGGCHWTTEILEYSLSAGNTASFDTANNLGSTCSGTSCPGVGLTLSGTNDVIVQYFGEAVAAVTAISNPYTSPADFINNFGGVAGAINTSSGAAPTWTVASNTSGSAGAIAISEITPGSGTSTTGTTAVTSRSDILSDSRPSATSNHTIAFTIHNSLDTTGWGSGSGGDATDTLSITFPSSFNLSNVKCKDVDLSFGGVATSIAGYFPSRSTSQDCPGSATSWGLFINPTASSMTFYTPTSVRTYVATGTPVQILIGTNASFQDAASNWITNPASAGVYTISVGGTFGGLGNMLVSINQGVSVQATVAESLAFTVSPSVTSIKFMQSNDTDCGSVTTCNLTFNSSVSSGDILIVGVRIGATGRTVTVSDNVNAGNYTQAVSQVQTTDGHQAYVFYKENVAAGSTQVTVAISGAAATIRFNIQEYHGIAPASSLDATNSSQGTGTNLSSGNITTAGTNELLFGLATNDNSASETWTAAASNGTNWTIRQQLADVHHPAMSEDLVATSVGTYTHNSVMSVSENWTSLIAAFKAANCPADDGATVTQIGSTATTVPFGFISPNTFYQGCQDLIVSTNAGNGYSVTVQESSAMKTVNGLYTIPDTTCDAGDCSVVTATTWVTPTKNGLGHTCVNQSGSDCNPTYGNGQKFKPLSNTAAGNNGATISFVQQITASTTAVTTLTMTLPALPRAGDALVLLTSSNGASGVTSVIGGGVTWIKIAASGANVNLDLWYGLDSSGASTTITVTYGATEDVSANVSEWSGIAIANALDVAWPNNSGSGGTTVTTVSATTTNANDLIIGGFAQNANASISSGPTNSFTQLTNAGGTVSPPLTGPAYRIVSSPGAYSTSWTVNTTNGWNSKFIALEANSGVGETVMSSTGTVTNSTGRVKYRLSAGVAQPAGTYTTIITYTIYAAY
jgi:hypothetical protein